jgi:hypothetical protein
MSNGQGTEQGHQSSGALVAVEPVKWGEWPLMVVWLPLPFVRVVGQLAEPRAWCRDPKRAFAARLENLPGEIEDAMVNVFATLLNLLDPSWRVACARSSASSECSTRFSR